MSFINKRLTIGDAEIMDLDEGSTVEENGRFDCLVLQKALSNRTYIQVGKACFESVSDEEVKDELAEHINDETGKTP